MHRKTLVALLVTLGVLLLVGCLGGGKTTPTYKLTITVVNKALDGRSIEGSEVRITSNKIADSKDTDGAGKVIFTGLSGKVDVLVSAPRFQEQSLSLNLSKDENITVELEYTPENRVVTDEVGLRQAISDDVASIILPEDIQLTEDLFLQRPVNLEIYATVTGNLTYDFEQVGEVEITGTGRIEGDLRADTPSSTIINSVQVDGTIEIDAVAHGTWNERYPSNNLRINCPDIVVHIERGAQTVIISEWAGGNVIQIDGPVQELIARAGATIFGATHIQHGVILSPEVFVDDLEFPYEGTFAPWLIGQSYEVSGHVQDSFGQGIEGVLIRFETAETLLQDTETEADGSWILSIPGGTGQVVPFKEGWTFDPSSYAVSEGRQHLDFVATPNENSRVSGRIGVKHRFSAVRQGRVSRSMWQPTPQAREDELIVMFDPSLAFSDQIGVLTGAGYTVVHSLRSLNAHLVRVDFQSQAAQLHAASLPGVISVEPNYVVSKSNNMIPNDPHYSHQWHYDWMRLPQAWNVTTGDRSIRIAVLDTGVDPNHEDLRANLDLEYAYDFVLGSSTMYDTDGHGTHVAGTIGAVTNNALGVAGVMWDVEILPLKVLDDSGEGSNYHLAWGVLYAAGLEDDLPYNPRPVDVINMSLGGSHNDLIEAAVQRVLQAGVAIVAATGNDGLSVLYPAAYEGVIGVGAVEVGRDGNPTKASYSNYGDGIDVVAPGGSWEYAVISTVPGSEYEAWAGTSMATPHVSGLVGLMLANDIPSHEIVDTLHRTSMPLTDADFDPYYGYGLVNAYWAINGVDRMRIIVGQRVEDTVQVTLESSLHPKGGEFDMLVAPGRYQLIAWVDVNRNNRVDQGDYYSESEYYSFEPGSELEFGGVIEEIGSWEDIDSQTEKGIGKQVRQ